MASIVAACASLSAFNMLCQACLDLWSTVRDHPPGYSSGEEPTLFEYPDSEVTWTGSHHLGEESFLTAVKQRCYICNTLYRDCSPELRKQAGIFRLFYQLRQVKDENSRNYDQDHYELEFTIEILQGKEPLAKELVFECTGLFKILPKTELSVPSEPLGLTTNTFTDKCKKQVQSWLDTCINSPDAHKLCQQDWRTNKNYPARLLNLARPDRFVLKVLDDRSDCPPYVTLSHCWEGDEMLKLKRENLDIFQKEGISFSSDSKQLCIPARFKDAMAIARWMQIDHIWIDALCIIQDDEADWFAQSTKMGDIYTNSYCNIAATNAGSNKGCFTSRSTDMVEPYSVPNPRANDEAKTYVVGYDDFWSNSLLDTPLHNRGWVLQERLLSPRTIHFGQEQIFWECRCEMACEAYPKGIPEQFRNHKTKAWRLADNILDPEPKILQTNIWLSLFKSMSSFFRPGRPKLASSQLTQVYGIWSKIVQRYMECKLTYRRDKLVAISGIAQKIAAITGEEYLAGHWKNSMLPQSLLWYVLGRRQADNTPAIRNPGPEDCAPSWSWASLEAQVIWNWPVECGKVLIEIIGTTVVETKGSKLGRISSASIDLTGIIYECDIQVKSTGTDGDPEEDGQYLVQLVSDNASEPGVNEAAMMEPTIYLDTPLLPATSCVRACLLPVCTEWRGRSGLMATKLAGLILRRISDSTSSCSFERIGMFGMDQAQTNELADVSGGKTQSIGKALSSIQRQLIRLV